MPETLDATQDGTRALAGRYELGELVGRGGMADVYRAHDRRLDRAVAVKIFRSHTDLPVHQRFDDEAHALARLAHPGLVSIYDVGTVDDRPFLVMEFVDGVSVQSRLLSGPLSLEDTLRAGAMLADALAHAHERGVVHRDVKPSNIMLDRDGNAHLTDFGIALLAGAPRLTGTNQVIGTPAYFAPEQLSGEQVGPAADVYALGLVLLECLTGEMAYQAGSNLETAIARLNRPPRIPAELPSDLARLLTAMTATDAALRPSAEQCARQLVARPDPAPSAAPEPVAWWADVSRTVQATALPARGPARRSRRRMLAASLAGVGAVAIALVFLLTMRQPSPGGPLGGVGHAQSGTSAGAGAGSGGGSGTTQQNPAGGPPGTGPAPNAGTLVAKQRPAVAADTTSQAPVSSAPASTSPIRTSPVTTSAEPTVTTSTGAPTTTSSSPAPPSSTDPQTNGSGIPTP